MNVKEIEEWLESIPSKGSRRIYRYSVRKFEKWYGKPIEALLGNPEETTKQVERFYVNLKEVTCQNTARSIVNGVVQFFKAFKTPVEVRKSLNVYHISPTTKDHQLSITEVQAMAKISDIREQMLLKVGLLGLRVGDVASLKWKTFDVTGEYPIEIQIPCKKEDTLAYTFVDAEFKEIFDSYMNTIDRKCDYLFQSARQDYLGERRIDLLLKELFVKAGLKSNKVLRWHCFRKLVMRTSVELGINMWSAKMLVGKVVSADIQTYIEGTNLRNDHLKLSNVLKLKGANGSKVSKLEDIVITLERENHQLKKRIELLQKNFESQETILKDINERLVHFEKYGKKKPAFDKFR